MLKILWQYLALLHKKVDPCENSGFLHVTHEVLYVTKLQYHTRTTLCKPLWQWFWNFFESRTINDRFFPVDHKIKWRTFFESVLFSKKLYLANIWTQFFKGFWRTINGPRAGPWSRFLRDIGPAICSWTKRIFSVLIN